MNTLLQGTLSFVRKAGKERKCVCARVELIVLVRYCALSGVRTWEGLVRVITLSLKECLSVFKPARHAARQSLLKRHNDAQQHPRGIPQTCARAHTHNIYRRSRPSSASLLLAVLLRPQQSSSSPLLSGKLSGGLFAQRVSQFLPSLSVSCIMSSSFFLCFLQISDGALWTSRNYWWKGLYV